jgi:hypothetical protein
VKCKVQHNGRERDPFKSLPTSDWFQISIRAYFDCRDHLQRQFTSELLDELYHDLTRVQPVKVAPKAALPPYEYVHMKGWVEGGV